MDRCERFLDALDWSLHSDEQAKGSAMLDGFHARDAAEAVLYTERPEEQIAAGVVGVLRFGSTPRP